MGKLKANEQNPRKITDDALKRLQHTMEKYGDLSGIVWNRRSGNIVAGHQRVKAMPDNLENALQIERVWETPTKTGTVAVGKLHIDGEEWNYREVDWDEETEKAANIAANKNAGEWDKPKLAQWLLELEAKGWAPEESGFARDEAEDIWKEPEPPKKKKVEFEVSDEPKAGHECPRCGYSF